MERAYEKWDESLDTLHRCALERKCGKQLGAKVQRGQKQKEKCRKIWDKQARLRLQPVPTVCLKENRIECGWCANKGCNACFNARERLAAKG